MTGRTLYWGKTVRDMIVSGKMELVRHVWGNPKNVGWRRDGIISRMPAELGFDATFHRSSLPKTLSNGEKERVLYGVERCRDIDRAKRVSKPTSLQSTDQNPAHTPKNWTTTGKCNTPDDELIFGTG